MKDEFLNVVKYMAEHGELLKAWDYLRNPPAYIEDDSDILLYLAKIQKQLDDMKQFQDKGTLNGRFLTSWVNPIVSNLVAFKHLRQRLLDLKLKNLVDVGCYTGWMGRELSLDGIRVHGIDIHPMVLQRASYVATGSLAVYEYLPVEKLGSVYPKQFDGAILFDVLEHTFDPELAIKNVERAVDGYIFINLPSPSGEHDSKDSSPIEEHQHIHAFSQKELNKLFPTAKIDVIENEGGNTNYFIEYKV